MVDEQTFVREVQDMERTLYRVSRGYLHSWEDCADAVQEAYFRPWLVRIVINECISSLRRKKRAMPAVQQKEEQAK